MFNGKIIIKDRLHVHILTEGETAQFEKECVEGKWGIMGTLRPDLRDHFTKLAGPIYISDSIEDLVATRNDISDEVGMIDHK